MNDSHRRHLFALLVQLEDTVSRITQAGWMGISPSGLTFGTISSLFGLTHGYITQSQYTMLVTAVIGSALVPTLIAQTFFKPSVEEEPKAHAVILHEPSRAYEEE